MSATADGSGGAEMQFDKVELAAPGEAQSCRICKRPIEGEYFEIARNVICGACAGALAGSKQGRGAFGRALLYGVGAALLGTIAWYAIVKITDREFGLLAIGVGLFVGIAVKKGARGLGGWRYQALAMALTYVSITASYVPLVIAERRRELLWRVRRACQGGLRAGARRGAVVRSGWCSAWPSRRPSWAAPATSWGFLIIGIGLYEAWKINRRVPLSGPFRFGPATPPLMAAAPGSAPPPPATL